ncbi:glycosyltransferase [Nanoarchaeota archaeon]
MISIIITAYREEKTIGKAIKSFLEQKIKGDYEILVVCPDEGTKKVVDSFSKEHKQVKHVQDPGKGKPIALNKAFKTAKGDVLILTDGDVYVDYGSVNKLLKAFENEKVGAVAGRPISLNSKKDMLGYWSHLLTDAGAHQTRMERVKSGKFIICSGYLFAMKKVFDEIPEDVLADDAVMSHMIFQKGYKIAYEPDAKVYVKYPTTFKDWILQKRRSAGGYNQIKGHFGNVPRMRSFWREIAFGWYKALAYASNLKEFYWTILLFFARIWLWISIFYEINLKKAEFTKVWKRVESTK